MKRVFNMFTKTKDKDKEVNESVDQIRKELEELNRDIEEWNKEFRIDTKISEELEKQLNEEINKEIDGEKQIKELSREENLLTEELEALQREEECLKQQEMALCEANQRLDRELRHKKASFEKQKNELNKSLEYYSTQMEDKRNAYQLLHSTQQLISSSVQPLNEVLEEKMNCLEDMKSEVESLKEEIQQNKEKELNEKSLEGVSEEEIELFSDPFIVITEMAKLWIDSKLRRGFIEEVKQIQSSNTSDIHSNDLKLNSNLEELEKDLHNITDSPKEIPKEPKIKSVTQSTISSIPSVMPLEFPPISSSNPLTEGIRGPSPDVNSSSAIFNVFSTKSPEKIFGDKIEENREPTVGSGFSIFSSSMKSPDNPFDSQQNDNNSEEQNIGFTSFDNFGANTSDNGTLFSGFGNQSTKTDENNTFGLNSLFGSSNTSPDNSSEVFNFFK